MSDRREIALALLRAGFAPQDVAAFVRRSVSTIYHWRREELRPDAPTSILAPVAVWREGSRLMIAVELAEV